MKVSKVVLASVLAVSSSSVALATEAAPQAVQGEAAKAATEAAPAASTTEAAATKATTLKSMATKAATFTTEQIVQIQKALKVAETGKLDEATTAALKAFQTENKLANTTGTPDAATAAALGLKF